MLSGISPAETAQRARALLADHLPDLDAALLFDDQYIRYYTAFGFIPTERPVALLITRGGERTLFVPRLETEHARQAGHAEQVVDYREFPDERHPMRLLADLLERLGLGQANLGCDHDGYPPVMGYWGPPLGELLPGARLRRIHRAVDRQMALKSPQEIALIRESARWAGRAHALLQAYTAAGLTEEAVSARASREASQELAQALGPAHRGGNRWVSGALALYRGQIGRRSALPHATSIDARFAAGDTLVTGASADVWGYLSELERTMFLGEPGPEQRRYFDLMLGAQDLAFETLAPGTTCAAVDRAVRTYFMRQGVWARWRHHTGHGLGQRIHESPFLDVGDDTVLEPGMVLSVEPGLYDPDWGGFRHSDTVLVTERGCELLTEYPRALERLVLPA